MPVCPLFTCDVCGVWRLQDYYWNCAMRERPRLFAMTASPGGKLTLEKTRAAIETLCFNMHCRITMPDKHEDELNKHVSTPEIELL